MIFTHGQVKAGQTELTGVGNISESEVDGQFNELFDPLLPFLSSDVRVVLIACSPFSGEPERAGRRARALLTYLNAPQGSVFGARSLVALPVLSKRYFPARAEWKVFTSVSALGMSLLILNRFLSGLPLDTSFEGLLTVFALPTAVNYGGYLIQQAIHNPLTQWASRQRLMNWGFLYTMNHGALLIQPKSFILEQDQILTVDQSSAACKVLSPH